MSAISNVTGATISTPFVSQGRDILGDATSSSQALSSVAVDSNEVILGGHFSLLPYHFLDFLGPNEGHPERIIPHLEKMQKGWIVSTGTERSFFDLIFAPPEKCEGVIVRDISWRVKAYVDTVTLLLRICENPENFQRYREMDQQHAEPMIRAAICNSNIPPKMKDYYLDNLNLFLSIYFPAEPWHEEPRFARCRYMFDVNQYSRLRKYAQEGKIIATTGDINNLNFLNGTNINVSVFDTSNISQYASLYPLSQAASNDAIIIQTLIRLSAIQPDEAEGAGYFSCINDANTRDAFLVRHTLRPSDLAKSKYAYSPVALQIMRDTSTNGVTSANRLVDVASLNMRSADVSESDE